MLNSRRPHRHGVFITDDGYLISNHHVVKDAAQVRLVTSAGTIPARVVQVDAANDLALLKADGRFAPLPILPSKSVQLGATVATVGFPDPGLQGFAPKLGPDLTQRRKGAKAQSRKAKPFILCALASLCLCVDFFGWRWRRAGRCRRSLQTATK